MTGWYQRHRRCCTEDPPPGRPEWAHLDQAVAYRRPACSIRGRRNDQAQTLPVGFPLGPRRREGSYGATPSVASTTARLSPARQPPRGHTPGVESGIDAGTFVLLHQAPHVRVAAPGGAPRRGSRGSRVCSAIRSREPNACRPIRASGGKERIDVGRRKRPVAVARSGLAGVRPDRLADAGRFQVSPASCGIALRFHRSPRVAERKEGHGRGVRMRGRRGESRPRLEKAPNVQMQRSA
jgi:hypothetical protein